jgi:hypothetical protein
MNLPPTEVNEIAILSAMAACCNERELPGSTSSSGRTILGREETGIRCEMRSHRPMEHVKTMQAKAPQKGEGRQAPNWGSSMCKASLTIPPPIDRRHQKPVGVVASGSDGGE